MDCLKFCLEAWIAFSFAWKHGLPHAFSLLGSMDCLEVCLEAFSFAWKLGIASCLNFFGAQQDKNKKSMLA
jgi:hypothetical protein